MKPFFITLGVGAVVLGALFYAVGDSSYRVTAYKLSSSVHLLPSVPEAEISTSSSSVSSTPPINPAIDEPPQPHLSNPPTVVRGIYLTNWVAGSNMRVEKLIALAKEKNINAVVVDIKDYSGYLGYAANVPLAKDIGAERELRISKPNALLKTLHEEGLYVIGRISVFQDPVLAAAHPEWAMKNKETGQTWKDRKGIAWMDPAAPPVWDYVAAIANDALARGFDEVNFDYIRFASDGNLETIQFPYWDEKNAPHKTLQKFFSYLHEHVTGGFISADLFGLVTVNKYDLGIGQVLEDAYPFFDYISPMVYPSHYASGFLGYKNPAAQPYEVVQYSMDTARTRRSALAASSSVPLAKLRPWLQAFNLGAVYDRSMIDKQTAAVEDVFAHSSSTDAFAGWLFWDPKNTYLSL